MNKNFKMHLCPIPKYGINTGIVHSIRNAMQTVYTHCTMNTDPVSPLGSVFLVFVPELNFGR